MIAPTAHPLRIAMSSYYLPSESKIGAGYMAHRLAQTMADRGHTVTMFSPCRRPDDARYDHVHVPIRGRLRTFRWPFHLRRLDLTAFDVYHAHGDDHLRIGRPTPAHIRTMHGSCLSEARNIEGAWSKLRMFLLGLTEIAATLVADRTILVSENTRTSFPWVHEVIPNGVDIELFHPGTKEQRPTILFVGTYERRKRGKFLMEVFAKDVAPAVPGAQLWMVCSDAPAAPDVEVLGTLTDDELADRYRRAWVFSLPSTYEGFGVPYIEAMASGTAVVATPNPGATEVLGAGRYGAIADDEDLGPTLVRMLSDPMLRERTAHEGLVRSTRYDWAAVAASYEQVYAELLASRAGDVHPRAGTRAVGEVLAGAVRALGSRSDEGLGPVAVAAADVDEDLIAAAILHGIGPVLAHAVSRAPDVGELDAALAGRLAFRTQATLVSHLRYLAELRTMGRALDEAGIGWVVTKGPVLSELAYPRPDLRPYLDLDLMVDRRRFEDAVEALEEVGAELYERNWELLRRQGKGELNLVTPTGGMIDLHWTPLYNRRLQGQFRYDGDDLLARRRRVCLGGTDAWVPDPTDHLLHVAAHATLTGAHRLVWVLDIHLAAAAGDIDWPALRSRAAEAGLADALSVILARTDRIVGLDGSEWRACLTSSLWSTGIAAFDRHHPIERWSASRPSWKFLPASTRRSTAVSIVESARHLGGAVAQLRDPAHPWRHRPDAPQRESEFRLVRGGASGRAAYFADIARG